MLLSKMYKTSTIFFRTCLWLDDRITKGNFLSSPKKINQENKFSLPIMKVEPQLKMTPLPLTISTKN